MSDTATSTSAIDDLVWDDWTPAQICSIENGTDCAACEG
ncbi:hypothetical protein NODU109028_21150 [Nocardioides dubius]